MPFTAEEKNALLDIARKTIASFLKEGIKPHLRIEHEKLLEAGRGAFVSLHKGNDLRGCIGVFTSKSPLYQTVSDMAISASTQDPRFRPLTQDELPFVTIEISVLSPLKKISEIKEIEVGRDGIYIVKGFHTGVLLPQVATEHGWNRETFLTHTCLKAGLPEGCWKGWKKGDVEIYTFQATVFREENG